MSRRGPYAKGQERRDEILRAAFDSLSRDGYAGSSLAGIGRAVGLDSAHIVYYFSSRELLLEEVLRSWDERNFAAMQESGDVFSGWIEAVRRNMRNPGLVQLYTAFAAEAVDDSHPAHAFFRQRFADLQGFFADEIRRRQRAGTAVTAVDADAAALTLIALSDGLQVRWLVDRSIDMAVVLERAIGRLLQADEGAD